MTPFKRRLLFGTALVMLIVIGLGAWAYFYGTRAALQHAEAFRFRRMQVAKLGEQTYRFYFVTNRRVEPGEGTLEERFENEREEGLKFGVFDTKIEPTLGPADFLCALISRGAPLAANGLKEVDVLLESEAVIIQTLAKLSDEKQALVDRILQRLDGVLQVRESKYIMLHAPRSALPEIRRLLPGSEAPTVMPLECNTDRIAGHAVCREPAA